MQPFLIFAPQLLPLPLVYGAVLINPATPRIGGQGLQQFRATVQGHNGFVPQTGVWTISAGSITAEGLATMPAPTLVAQAVTVTFTATAGAVGTATVTVPAQGEETFFPINSLAEPSAEIIDVVADTYMQGHPAMVGLMVGSAGRVLARNAHGRDRGYVLPSGGGLIPGQFSIVRGTGTTATSIKALMRSR